MVPAPTEVSLVAEGCCWLVVYVADAARVVVGCTGLCCGCDVALILELSIGTRGILVGSRTRLDAATAACGATGGLIRLLMSAAGLSLRRLSLVSWNVWSIPDRRPPPESRLTGGTATPAAAVNLSALLRLSSAIRACSSSSCSLSLASVSALLFASRASRRAMTSLGVGTRAAGDCGTGTGPAAVRDPPFWARILPDPGATLPPPRSDIEAFSSTISGVKGNGVLMASSSANSIADAVLREMCVLRRGQ